MDKEKDPDGCGSTLPRRQLGRHLREAREACGLTLVEAAKIMEWSKSTLQRLEKGQAERVRVHDIETLCQIYAVPDQFASGLKGLAQQASVKCWWHGYGDLIPANFNVYVGLEASARHLAIYQPQLVPGLLQIPDYARALDRQYFAEESEDELDRRIQVRSRRQAVLTRPRNPADARVVLHEAVIRTCIGNARIMASQLRHLADMSTRPNIDLRILPFHAGSPLGRVFGPLVLLDFDSDPRGRPIEPSIAFAESYLGGKYFERVEDVDRCRAAHDAIQRAALDAQPTRDLLRQLARSMERG